MDNNALKTVIPSIVELIGIYTAFDVMGECLKVSFTDDCRRCHGNGKVACTACRGLGYLRTAPKMTNSLGIEVEDDTTAKLCEFCGTEGIHTCPNCNGSSSFLRMLPNQVKMFMWEHPFARHMEDTVGKRARSRALSKILKSARKDKESARPILSLDGIGGGFKITGSAAMLAAPDEEVPAQ
eukprot:jgi/Mesvir1/14333/Mv09743-RA.1